MKRQQPGCLHRLSEQIVVIAADVGQQLQKSSAGPATCNFHLHLRWWQFGPSWGGAGAVGNLL